MYFFPDTCKKFRSDFQMLHEDEKQVDQARKKLEEAVKEEQNSNKSLEKLLKVCFFYISKISLPHELTIVSPLSRGESAPYQLNTVGLLLETLFQYHMITRQHYMKDFWEKNLILLSHLFIKI